MILNRTSWARMIDSTYMMASVIESGTANPKYIGDNLRRLAVVLEQLSIRDRPEPPDITILLKDINSYTLAAEAIEKARKP